jgi:excisionase family DNA binding protein
VCNAIDAEIKVKQQKNGDEMTEKKTSELLTLSQTAQILHCSVGTVRNLVKLGKLACLRFGIADKVVRIHQDDLLAFIDQNRQAASIPTPTVGSPVQRKQEDKDFHARQARAKATLDKHRRTRKSSIHCELADITTSNIGE